MSIVEKLVVFEMNKHRNVSLQTIVAQACHFLDNQNGAVVPGIQPSTTYARDDEYNLRTEFRYSRESNPTTSVVEQVLTEITGGVDTLLFNSGMSAVASVFDTLRPGDHVVAPRVMYHGAQDLLRRLAETKKIEVSFFDQTSNHAMESAIRAGVTKLVWVEPVVNPNWDVIDVASAARVAHDAGAILAMDSTVAPPCTTDSFGLGADIVFQSATKYLAGHSDLTAGVLTTAVDSPLWQELRTVRKLNGGVLPAFEAWLLLRGLRTLSLRYERSSENAMMIAEHFLEHAMISEVLYPGLTGHPRHSLACDQMTNGFSGMLSLLLNGDEQSARNFAAGTNVFIPATSLGGVESLIEHRKSVEGPNSIVPANLVRLSVGIESAGDLIGDLEQALSRL